MATLYSTHCRSYSPLTPSPSPSPSSYSSYCSSSSSSSKLGHVAVSSSASKRFLAAKLSVLSQNQNVARMQDGLFLSSFQESE